jgi:branched-subunit amino acid transport protein AzlD
VLTCAVITWALRAVSFAVLAPLRQSALVAYLGSDMHVGVMAILVTYTLGHATLTTTAQAAPLLTATTTTTTTTATTATATAALHLWRRNMVLGMFGGTLIPVLLASTLITT